MQRAMKYKWEQVSRGYQLVGHIFRWIANWKDAQEGVVISACGKQGKFALIVIKTALYVTL